MERVAAPRPGFRRRQPRCCVPASTSPACGTTRALCTQGSTGGAFGAPSVGPVLRCKAAAASDAPAAVSAGRTMCDVVDVVVRCELQGAGPRHASRRHLAPVRPAVEGCCTSSRLLQMLASPQGGCEVTRWNEMPGFNEKHALLGSRAKVPAGGAWSQEDHRAQHTERWSANLSDARFGSSVVDAVSQDSQPAKKQQHAHTQPPHRLAVQ